MRDGVVLRADVYRPLGGGVHPVLLLRLPYDKTAANSNFGYSHPSWYARQGYIVVVQDTRGRYTSDGDFYPFLHEAEDGYDTIEWAAALPGSNGRVGMYGFSYPGADPAARRDAAAAVARDDLPRPSRARSTTTGWTYNQGAFALAFAAPWAAVPRARHGATHRRRGRHASAARRARRARTGCTGRCRSRPGRPSLERHAPYFTDWLDHPTYDDYWRRWSIDDGLQPPARAGAAHRRLVRHVPPRPRQELRRAAAGSPAASRSS